MGSHTHISPLCPAALRAVFLWGGKQNTKVQTYFMVLPHSFQKSFLAGGLCSDK